MLKNKTTKQITLLALFTAIEIVISRFLSFSVWNMKIGLAFIPVMLAAYLVGPVGGLIVGGLSDFLGAILFPIGAYFPGFTATAALTGLVFGLCFYKKINLPRIILAVVSTQLVCGLLLNSWFISVLYGSPFTGLLVTRLPQIGIMIAVEFLFAQFVLSKFKVLNKIKI